ncbi:MAG TPA: membrane protein insertion efficiency factor YidD [Candidatus Brocadiales bacterium]|nr:membrane protein insertion efficiency factor YidD [Candidatus Brocadiales bacterium]
MKGVLIGLIRIYQLCIAPLLPQACRYDPSCSQYMIEAIHKKGVLLGLSKGIWRILRCHPFGGSGYDSVER